MNTTWMPDGFRQRLTFVTPRRAPVKIVFGERGARGVQRFDHPRIITDHEPSAKMLREQWPDAHGAKREADWYLDLPKETVLSIIVDEQETRFRFEERDKSGYLVGSCDGTTCSDLTTRTQRPCSCSTSEASKCRPSVGLRGSLMLPTVGKLVSVWQSSHAANFARELATVPQGTDPLVIGIRLVGMRATMRTATGTQAINTVRPAVFYALRMPKSELTELLAEKLRLDELTELLGERSELQRYGLTELEPTPEPEPEHVGSVVALGNVGSDAGSENEIVGSVASEEALLLDDDLDGGIDVESEDGANDESFEYVEESFDDANELVDDTTELFGRADPKPSLPPLRRRGRGSRSTVR